jgi:hypothetical protein
MGIERAATRWYLQRIAYENECSALETKLVEMQSKPQGPISNERAETERRLADIRAKLHALGPCPKAMMG